MAGAKREKHYMENPAAVVDDQYRCVDSCHTADVNGHFLLCSGLACQNVSIKDALREYTITTR